MENDVTGELPLGNGLGMDFDGTVDRRLRAGDVFEMHSHGETIPCRVTWVSPDDGKDVRFVLVDRPDLEGQLRLK